MASEFKVPELGENIHSGDVLKILVKKGDLLKEGQPVLELETGKATIEVPATVSGKIKSISVKEGDKVSVGQVVLTVDGGAGATQPGDEKPAPAAPKTPAPNQPAPAPATAPARPAPTTTATPAAPAPAADPNRPPVAAAPSVRKFAREIGVDINQVAGSGPGGRVSEDDVKAHAKRLLTSPAAAPAAGTGVAVPPLPDFSMFGPVQREAMNMVRKITAQHMSVSWSVIPHVTQHDRADITELEKLRKRFAKKAEDAGGKLTPTAVLVKVVASALKVYPQFNASLDLSRQETIYKKHYHIGVAVDSPRGLIVPVIRDADQKNIIELAVELTQLAQKVRDGKITPAELQGGTFTLSNLGGIGGGHFAPIINYPEVAILGIGRAEMAPVYLDGGFQPRLMLPLSLSYDHRLIDGADGARFLRWIAEAIHEPLLLALEG
jgi:pyruvate dehydrogenase E2 component (dihydrolipoamide acetyltransferase)